MATTPPGPRSDKGSRSARVPRKQLAKAREGQFEWVLAACERVLRPVVRLALGFGIKHAHLEQLLRDVLLDEARRTWLEEGTEPNISQLSVTTGLNRKIVTSKVRALTVALPHTEMSAEAKALTLWLQMYAEDSALRVLPLTAEHASTPSFEAVARRATHGNLHHRAMLEELVRLNMVSVRDGRAELLVAGFVPTGDLHGMLAFLGDNARDHLMAGVSNTLGGRPPLLERAVFASGITLEDCERIHQVARKRWEGLHDELTREMRSAYESADEHASGRIRVGIYTYYEDTAAAQLANAVPGPQPAPPETKA